MYPSRAAGAIFYPMSLTSQVLLALVAGFAVGLPLAGAEAPLAVRLLAALEPLGLLFVNAIRMTVIPLVVSSLVVGVASAPDQRTVGRLGARALLLFIVAVAAAALVGVTLGPPLLARIPIDPAAIAALQASAPDAASGAAALPSAGEWLVSSCPRTPSRRWRTARCSHSSSPPSHSPPR